MDHLGSSPWVGDSDMNTERAMTQQDDIDAKWQRLHELDELQANPEPEPEYEPHDDTPIFAAVAKLGITGPPRAGKTTGAKVAERSLRAKGYGHVVLHTDDLIRDISWPMQAKVVSNWLNLHDEFLIEGVTLTYGLELWLERHHEGKPLDKLVWLDKPHGYLSQGQQKVATQVRERFRYIEPILSRRGVVIYSPNG